METIDDPEHRALRLARTLGIPQEARRLGSSLVASEHLLMATLSDPLLRWRVKDLGVDLRDVQTLVGEATEGRPARTRPGLAITSQAADVLVEVAARTDGLDPDRRPEPGVFSASMACLLGTFLREERDCAARRILAELDLLQYAALIVDATR